MFGFDWIAILAAAIGGALGGALGALLASFTKNATIRTMLIVAPAILAGRLAQPVIQPELEKAFGPAVRTAQFDAIYDSEIRPDLVAQPSLQRIFKDNPSAEVSFKEQMRKAYQQGGSKAALEAAPGIGATVLGDSFITYMPRARAEDIIGYARTMATVLTTFTDKDPEGCVQMLFGAQHGQAITNSRLTAAIGEAGVQSMLKATNDVVQYAGDARIPFDKVRGETLLGQVAQRHAGLLVGKSGEVASGTRMHATRDEAHGACSFSAALFTDIAGQPTTDAEAVLRFMFAGA